MIMFILNPPPISHFYLHLLKTTMNKIIDILNTSEILGEETDISNETYGPIYNFIKTRGFYGSKQREVIIRKAELIEEKSAFIPTVTRMAMDIMRHQTPSDLRMACIIFVCCKYISENNTDKDLMKDIVQTLEDKLARDSSRRSIIKEEEKLEKASLVASHENKIRQEAAKTREAEAVMRGAESSMRESGFRMLDAEYSMRRSEAVMREAEASAKIVSQQSESGPCMNLFVGNDDITVDDDSMARDKELFDNLDLGDNVGDIAEGLMRFVKIVEPTKSRKVMDGTVTMVEPIKKRKVDMVDQPTKKKYKSHVVKLGSSIILGEGLTCEDIPLSKSDRLAQVALAISETGGGMDGVFSSVRELVGEMREGKNKYNRDNGLTAPGVTGINDLVVRVNLNNMLYEEKYLPLRQYIGQSEIVDEKFIQNAFSLVSKQTGKFQKSFPSISYCKLGTQSKSQGALVIDMSR